MNEFDKNKNLGEQFSSEQHSNIAFEAAGTENHDNTAEANPVQFTKQSEDSEAAVKSEMTKPSENNDYCTETEHAEHSHAEQIEIEEVPDNSEPISAEPLSSAAATVEPIADQQPTPVSQSRVYYSQPSQPQQSQPAQPANNPNQWPPRNGYAPYWQQPNGAVVPQRSGAATQQTQQTQQSQGYYSPYTNEYIYNPQNGTRKKKKAGKIALATIVTILSAFVISVLAISGYIAINGKINTDADNREVGILEDDTVKKPLIGKTPQKDSDKDSEVVTDNKEDADDDEDKAVNSETEIRNYPSLEQLAAPSDALTLPDIYDKVSPSVVGVSCTVRGGIQTGTGIIISEDGYILTNAHVIENYVSVMIVDGDQNEYEAEVIGADEQTDIAVLKIDPEDIDLVACEFGISSDLRIGELVVAIGNPLGFDLYGTMTDGIISGLNRTVNIGDKTMTLLQTSASINNGNSGGPLVDAYGRVIGITSAKVDSMYGEGLGFAIPIDEALPIVDSLIKYGYVTGRPMIGISGQDITEIMSLYYRMPRGVYVMFVTPDSGAEDAGILPGDIIIGIEGNEISSMDELNSYKNNFSAGDTITLTIYRSGQSFDVDIVLGEATSDDN